MKSQLFAIATALIAIHNANAGEPIVAHRYTNNGTPYVYRHSSTLEEGIMRGIGDAARGIGDYNYNTSLAAINVQTARQLAMENSVRYAEKYFEKKDVWRKNMRAKWNRNYVRQHIAPAVEAPAAVEGQQAQTRTVSIRQPRRANTTIRMSSNQINRTNGRIHWPAQLRTSDFAKARHSVSRRFQHMHRTGSAPRGTRTVIDKMIASLKTQINDMPTTEYLAAKRFLTNLKTELQFGPSVELASSTPNGIRS